MPWSNQSGGGGSPWGSGGGGGRGGNGGRGQGPWGPGGGGQPNLEDLLGNLQDKLRRIIPGGAGSSHGFGHDQVSRWGRRFCPRPSTMMVRP